MPINKHRKSNSKPKQQQQQQPQPPKQQPLTTTTNTITSNSNSDSNSTTSKPSLFTKSHHTLLAVTSLSNLRNSSNHHQQTTTTTHNPSNPIKRSNSISSDQILAHSNFHYITHSNLKSSEHQTKSSSSSSSFTSSFKQSDFFKRSTKLSNPTSTLKSNSSLDLKVLSTSHDSNNNKSSSNLKKPNHSTTSLIEPSILIKHNQTNPNRFNLKTKSVNSNSSNIHHHHLSIQSESTNSSSSTFNQFSPTKTLENNSTTNESNSGKKVESIDTNPSQKTEPSKKSLEVLNQKIEPTKKPSDNSTKKTEPKKSIDNSNKKNEPNKKSIELSNKKSLDTSNKRSLEITNKKNESVTTLGIFSGTSTTSLVSNTSSTNHTQPHHSSMNFSSNNNNNNNNNNNTNNSGSSNANHKPVIRHITSTSTLASTQFTGNHNGFGQKLENPNFGLVLGHQVGGESNGSLVLRPGDLWSQIVMRVIPLFNGEGHKGFIEDLNEFVIQYISKTISDSPSKSIQKLTNDLQDLLTSGVMSLNHKFSADTLSDERFLIRLMEIWHFFFTGVLPTLEAIFLPLMTDEKLISVLESKNNKLLQERLQQIHLLQQVSSTSGLPPSSTSLLFKIQPKDPNETLVKKSNLGIDVRRIALECFRDSMISSVFNRFYKLLSYLYDDSLEGFNEPLSMDLVNEISHFKRLQMIGLLCGSVPNPEIEALGKLIRSGKADPSYLKEDEDLEPKDDGKCTNGLASLKTGNPAGNLSLSPTIRSWNKNREFTRRSIRRQLGKSSLLHHHHHHHQASKLSLSSLKTSLDLKSSDPSFSNPNETENETLVQSSSGTGTSGNTGNTGNSGQTLHSLESFKFSADHLKHVVQSKINKSMNYFGTQSVSLDDHGSIAEAV